MSYHISYMCIVSYKRSSICPTCIPMHCLSTEGCQNGAGWCCEAERFTISRRHLLQPQPCNHQTSAVRLQCLVYLEIQDLNPSNFHPDPECQNDSYIEGFLRLPCGFLWVSCTMQWPLHLSVQISFKACCRVLLEQNCGMIWSMSMSCAWQP